MNPLKFILILFFSVLFRDTFGQYYYYNDKYYESELLFEMGAGAGLMNCITDIGGANSDKPNYINEIRRQNNRFSKSIYAGIMYQDILAARVEGTLGEVTSYDSSITGKSNNLISKTNRNLSFRSKILEVSFLVEIHPLEMMNLQLAPYLSPYLVAGLGWFHFNPQANLNGKWIDLQPLHTEGQGFAEYPDRKPYQLSQFNLPLGAGLRYDLSDKLNLRIEFVHRRLFTDYLDDASTKKYIDPALFSKYLSPADAANARALFNRSVNGAIPAFRGHFQNKDAFMSLSLKLGIVFGRESTGGDGNSRHLRWKF